MTPSDRSDGAQSVLEPLLASSRVLVVAGAGGVGKTTIAAALGVAAAQRGRKVLCLTIDPAQRLAEALGLRSPFGAEQPVDLRPFARPGQGRVGSLTALMLDTKTTFDALVLKYASSPERAQRLLGNKLYRYVSTSLAGTHEYMAMEKLAEIRRSGRFDLVVLDTPPTTNALDFLDAPERLVQALDSATIRFFVQAFDATGKFSLNLLTRSASVVLRGLGRITGAGFLEEAAVFLSELNDLFGGFRERARAVETALRSDDLAFVLVTSPAAMSIDEVLFFDERLTRARMQRGAFVINRMRRVAGREPSTAQVLLAAAARGTELDTSAAERVVAAYRETSRLAALDQLHLRVLETRAAGSVPLVRLPELSSDVRDLRALGSVAELLAAGGV